MARKKIGQVKRPANSLVFVTKSGAVMAQPLKRKKKKKKGK